ncbi:MAG: 4-hydroxy-tetrahydrodipicolinate reductase [Butyrivibrio sp.]|nr:4-hydroxy-tetrahydrodipicolinate reductase [Butyrivibrio sp.]
MTRIIMHGCNGKMGQVITGIVEADANAQIVAGIDMFDDGHNAYPVFSNINDCNVEADVIIDFCSVNAIDGLVDYCSKTKTPVVVCTTGLSEEQIGRIEELSKTCAVLRSANMSLGINTLTKILKQVSALFAEAGFDIEIVEKHHRLKLDAPSGTALALADAINESLPEKYDYKFDRSADRIKRPQKEIGISAVRGGTIVGEHEIIFAGEDEVIELKHTAYSKSIFAKGAVEAAKFLNGKDAGFYTMKDVIG